MTNQQLFQMKHTVRSVILRYKCSMFQDKVRYGGQSFLLAFAFLSVPIHLFIFRTKATFSQLKEKVAFMLNQSNQNIYKYNRILSVTCTFDFSYKASCD